MKKKIKITLNDLLVYAISGAVLFNLLQFFLYGILWVSKPIDSESTLQGIVFLIALVLSVPANCIIFGLGLEHSRFFGVPYLINGLVGALLFIAVMFIREFIRNGNREVKP